MDRDAVFAVAKGLAAIAKALNRVADAAERQAAAAERNADAHIAHLENERERARRDAEIVAQGAVHVESMRNLSKAFEASAAEAGGQGA